MLEHHRIVYLLGCLCSTAGLRSFSHPLGPLSPDCVSQNGACLRCRLAWVGLPSKRALHIWHRSQTSGVPPLGHGHVPATWHLIRLRVWPQADQTLTKFTKPSNSYSLLCSLQFRCPEGSDHLGMCQTRGSFKLVVFLLCPFKCSDGFCQHKRRLRQVGGCQKYGPLFGPCFVFLSAGST